MAFSYDVKQLEDSYVFRIRLMTGLTSEDFLFQTTDEEIKYFYKVNKGNERKSARDIINSVLPQAVEFTDTKTGQVEENGSQLFDNLIKLRDELNKQLAVPKNIHATGLDSTEYHEGHRNKEIVHGPRTGDAFALTSEMPNLS